MPDFLHFAIAGFRFPPLAARRLTPYPIALSERRRLIKRAVATVKAQHELLLIDGNVVSPGAWCPVGHGDAERNG